MKIIKRIGALLLVFALLIPTTQALAADDDGITVYFDGTEDYAMAYEVLDLVNKERADNDLAPLSMDTYLMETAMQRAKEIAIYFDHTRPDGTICFTAFPSRFDDSARGENVAAGQPTANYVMLNWMNSTGHRENILADDYKSIGIGCFYQEDVVHWVQLFSSAPATVPASRPENRKVTAEVDVIPGYAYLDYDFFNTEDEEMLQTIVYNINPEYEYDVILFNNKNITFATTPESIVQVSPGGLLPVPERPGFMTISCKIGDMLIFSEMLVFSDHNFKTGDVDGDGNVNNADLILIARRVVGMDAELDPLAADINCDNVITNADIILLARFLVGLDTEL